MCVCQVPSFNKQGWFYCITKQSFYLFLQAFVEQDLQCRNFVHADIHRQQLHYNFPDVITIFSISECDNLFVM